MSAQTCKVTELAEIIAHPLFASGLRAYSEERFFQAHEIWEDLWRQTEGPYRDGIRALIQLAAGFVKLRQGELTGARALWRRAVRNANIITTGAPTLAPVFASAQRLADLADAGDLATDSLPPPIPDPATILTSLSSTRDS
ncbi:MAG: DUF309 domain-containing protein [bacterium JZ-2024 1]